MRFIAFLAGLVLVAVPTLYIGTRVVLIDDLQRGSAWPSIRQFLRTDRFGLPLWLVGTALFLLGAWLMFEAGRARASTVPSLPRLR